MAFGPNDISDAPNIVKIPSSTFTTSGGKVNEPVFKQQLNDAGLSVTCVSVNNFQGQACVCTFSGDVTPVDIVSIDTTAAAHTGAPFEPTKREWYVAGPTQAPYNSLVDGLVANANMFPAGNYVLEWYAEVRVSDEAANTYGKAVLHFNTNGQPIEARCMSTGYFADWTAFSGKIPLVLKDGDSVQAKLTIQRPTRPGKTASASNAEIRRCRVFIERDD